jgi:hypothetical protein
MSSAPSRHSRSSCQQGPVQAGKSHGKHLKSTGRSLFYHGFFMVFSTLNSLNLLNTTSNANKCYNMNIWGFNARVCVEFQTPFIRLEPRETLPKVGGGKAPVGAESVAVATAAAAVCSSLEPPWDHGFPSLVPQKWMANPMDHK